MTRFTWRPGDFGPPRFGLKQDQWNRLVLLYEDVQTGARTEWPPEYIPPHWHLMKHLVSTGRVNDE
jgi:hypothetical protein